MTVKKAAADVYAATIDDKVAVKLGPGDWWVPRRASQHPLLCIIFISGSPTLLTAVAAPLFASSLACFSIFYNILPLY